MATNEHLSNQKIEYGNVLKDIELLASGSKTVDFSGHLSKEFIGNLSKDKAEKLIGSIFDAFSFKKIPEILITFINLLGKMLGIENIYDRMEKTKYIFGYKLKQSHLNLIGDRMKEKFPKTPLNSGMIKKACENRTLLPVEYLLAFMQNDSGLGTTGKGARTRNPGNVGNDDAGNLRTFSTRQEGVDACAGELQKRIDKYFKLSAECKGVGFNTFPTPQELATGKAKCGKKFSGIYMSDSGGPARVASIVKTRNKVLLT